MHRNCLQVYTHMHVCVHAHTLTSSLSHNLSLSWSLQVGQREKHWDNFMRRCAVSLYVNVTILPFGQKTATLRNTTCHQSFACLDVSFKYINFVCPCQISMLLYSPTANIVYSIFDSLHSLAACQSSSTLITTWEVQILKLEEILR